MARFSSMSLAKYLESLKNNLRCGLQSWQISVWAGDRLVPTEQTQTQLESKCSMRSKRFQNTVALARMNSRSACSQVSPARTARTENTDSLEARPGSLAG